jgi:HJR/Mrr/RecB family endonuclease
MYPSTPTPRSNDIYTSDIPYYIGFLENYLGVEEVSRRLQQIDKAIKTERGVYLNYWLLPNSSFWIGIREARQVNFSKHISLDTLSESLERTLEIAAKLKILDQAMSPRVKTDLRTRILKADYLTPIFFEIDMAAHFWQLGYEIKWSEPVDEQGKRIPEFTLSNGNQKIEIECKSKRADAGRKIIRPYFYKLVDEIAAPLSTAGYTGEVSIVVPDRMPIKNSWRKQVASAIDQLKTSTNTQMHLDDGTEITINLHNLGGIVIPAENVFTEAQKNKHPYSQLAIFAQEYDKTLSNPLIFELRSQTEDRFLQDIFENLQDANHQFTRNHPSMICCFVPEVDSFDGLQQDSALLGMTATFFNKHAGPNVFAVSYSSDAIRKATRIDVSKSSPAIRFDNPLYDEKFGARIRGFQ